MQGRAALCTAMSIRGQVLLADIPQPLMKHTVCTSCKPCIHQPEFYHLVSRFATSMMVQPANEPPGGRMPVAMPHRTLSPERGGVSGGQGEGGKGKITSRWASG